MSTYITGTFFAIMFAYIAGNIKRSKQYSAISRLLFPLFFSFLSFFILTWIMAVRYKVGTDYLEYSYFYQYVNLMVRNSVELGFQWFNKVLILFSENPQIFFVFSSVIICAGYFAAIYKESISPAYSILLFVLVKDYFMAMNAVRQYMATAIALYAIPYIKDRDWKKVIPIIIIAILFHKSAIVFLILYILFQVRLRPVVWGGVMVGVFFSSNLIVQYIYPLIQKYNLYAKYFSNNYANSTGDLNWSSTLIYFCFFILLSFGYKKINDNKKMRLLYTAVVLGLTVLLMGSILPYNAHRVAWHMNSLLVLYIPEAVKTIFGKRTVRIAANIAIIIAFAITTFSSIMGGSHGVLPYQTFWQGTI